MQQDVKSGACLMGVELCCAVACLVCLAGISAGVIAGMLGLGGGLVLAPLMLELGVSPAVSAASTQVWLVAAIVPQV